jgi:hypothetical protein
MNNQINDTDLELNYHIITQLNLGHYDSIYD